MPAIADQASAASSDFLRVMRERGYVHQMSDEAGIEALAARGELNTYVGYDCTAPSLHVGSLISIMMLHWLQVTGAGRPIVLMGGGTTRVGDPSGKDAARQILTVDQIDANKDSLKQVFGQLMRFGDGALDAVMVDNADWLTKLNYIDFLRDVGRHFSVNRMLSFDGHPSGCASSAARSSRFSSSTTMLPAGLRLRTTWPTGATAAACSWGATDQWGNIVAGARPLPAPGASRSSCRGSPTPC